MSHHGAYRGMSLDVPHTAPVSHLSSSSLRQRSLSRASQRPTSRLSQRSKTPRLAGLLNTLVKQVKGLSDDSEGLQQAVELASKHIDQVNQPIVPDLTQIEARFKGYVKKARINLQDALADLTHAKYSELKRNVAQHTDLDSEIKLSMLPNHLQFLLLLSSPPTAETLSRVHAIVEENEQDASRSPPWSWKKILQEEPFEGQHWQGAFGLPEGSIVETWDTDISEDVSSLDLPASPEEVTSSIEDGPYQPPQEISHEDYSSTKHVGRELVEKLQARQYWRLDWRTDAEHHSHFNIGDASTLVVLLHRQEQFSDLKHESFVDEIDAVRDMLIALQGRRSCLFQIGSDKDPQAVTVLNHRRIAHLTPASQASILGVFASYASILNPLRDVVSKTHKQLAVPSSSTVARCRTYEALSAAIGRQLLLFDKWCAEREECMNLCQRGESSSSHVISLLSLEEAVRMRLARTFHELLSIIRVVEKQQDNLSPSNLSALILNSLLESVRGCSAIGDTSTAESLMDVWRESVAPLWGNIQRWLKDGIPVHIGLEGETYITKPMWDEKEFFIHMNPLVDLGSPEFWDSSYTIPQRHNIPDIPDGEVAKEVGVPVFLQHIAEDILAAGKAIGLLRALNMSHLLGNEWLKGWPAFGKVTEHLPLRGLKEDLEHLVSDALISPCKCAQSSFRKVLVEACNLWEHVLRLERVYLMRRGDAMSQFGERLFVRMDASQPWNDFHFLNSVFQDVATYASESWINPSLVRISYHGAKDMNARETVRAIDGLSIEYAVPFPLGFLFGPDTNANYSLIFSFLLQIRRSKSVLDRILVRGVNRSAFYSHPHLKSFYGLRSKLSWFVNALLNFIVTDVIHAALTDFHETLRKAASLDEMILIHRSHLDRLLHRCLLLDRMSELHHAILSVLDICLRFSNCLSAFANETSMDVSRHSLLGMRLRHRRRGGMRRFHKQDVIGSVKALVPIEDDTESEEDEAMEPQLFAGETSMSYAEDGSVASLERMNVDLDRLVRFICDGVESLAGGLDGDRDNAGATFGVLAFSLGNWVA